MEANLNTITINSIEYVRADSVKSAPTPTGNRAVVVINSGWIYAGDLTEENGRIFLDRAVWVFKWNNVGFAEVLKNPKSTSADIRKMSHRVDIPAHSEIYRIPVCDDWGL